MRIPTIYIIYGAPCTGKSTLARLLDDKKVKVYDDICHYDFIESRGLYSEVARLIDNGEQIKFSNDSIYYDAFVLITNNKSTFLTLQMMFDKRERHGIVKPIRSNYHLVISCFESLFNKESEKSTMKNNIIDKTVQILKDNLIEIIEKKVTFIDYIKPSAFKNKEDYDINCTYEYYQFLCEECDFVVKPEEMMTKDEFKIIKEAFNN